ncbi:MAG: 4Fe-4S binding protein [Planctomycetota bacterium]|jgi:Fe-S-cluster-containing hydrogenase component 2|nr:4Fe-4S binding protein [Planctomycetota bacterium]
MAAAERKVVHIDAEKCNGCGRCAHACHEGAIQMVHGKAQLASDLFCDGLGDCLGPCPTGAISIITRQAEDYDPAAVEKRMAEMKRAKAGDPPPYGCPGSASRELKNQAPAPYGGCPGSMAKSLKAADAACAHVSGDEADQPTAESELMNWPVQLKLVPAGAPYLKGADMLLAADCTAFAVPDFHNRYLRNKPVLIACPKLEDNDPQAAKLVEIARTARPASLTVLRMEVPCCGGLVRVAREAVRQSDLDIPVNIIIVGIDGLEKCRK